MQPEIAQLNKNEHKNIKLVTNRDFSHIAEHHVTPVIAEEIPVLAQELPIAFIKSSQADGYVCVAVLGFKENENLMVKDGEWKGNVIPAGYSHYPLAIVKIPDQEDQYTMTIATNSKAISDEGEALFNEDGSDTEYFEKRRQALERYYGFAMRMPEFTKTIVDLDLLEERPFSIDINEDQRKVSGLFFVSEQKLNDLPDDKFLELRKKGYLAPIYGHLLSIAQVPNLAKRISDK